MTKFYGSPMEWFPVTTLSRTPIYRSDVAADFTAAEVADLLRVQKEFSAWQRLLCERLGCQLPTEGTFELIEDSTAINPP